jgi:hypothetical protein
MRSDYECCVDDLRGRFVSMVAKALFAAFILEKFIVAKVFGGADKQGGSRRGAVVDGSTAALRKRGAWGL